MLTLDRARPKNVESAKDIIEIRLLLIYDRSILQLRLVWKIAYSSILFVGKSRCRLHSLFVYSEVLVYNKYKAEAKSTGI